jgi:hypothetical protein
MGTRLSGGRTRSPGVTAPARLDVDRVLSSQYLAAVARELLARGLPVDAAVLHDRACGGGRVIFALPADAPADRPLPLYARWDGGRRWTLLVGFPAGAEQTCRTSLRLRHLPAPVEVAEFVAEAAANAAGSRSDTAADPANR